MESIQSKASIGLREPVTTINNYKEIEDILNLVFERCTTEQIQELLRTRKENNNVRISAENKTALIYKNLREAIDSRAIAIEKVFDLIRASEENGNQHVFYYKPTSPEIHELLRFETVANNLWGETWGQVVKEFPKMKLVPNDFQFSDFRSLTTKNQDWILKIYGHTEIEKFTGDIMYDANGIGWKKFVKKSLRIVLLVKWNSLGVLEIRVQRDESDKRIRTWHDLIWKLLKPAVQLEQFENWKFSDIINELINKQNENKKIYTFRDAKVLSNGVRVEFQTIANEGDLLKNQETRDSLTGYMTANAICDGLST